MRAFPRPSRTASPLVFACLACACLALAAAPVYPVEFEAISVGFSQAWTGNAYVPPAFDVTGSEAMPIDGFLSAGVRVPLVDGFLAGRGALLFTPALQVGMRRYVLYASGMVVPAAIETGTGAEGSELGLGSARFLTLRLQLPLALRYSFSPRAAVLVDLSPTGVFRMRAGEVERLAPDTNLSGFAEHFYGSLRFLMPEGKVGFQFGVSDYLDATIHAGYAVSVMDVAGPPDEALPDLPAWHAMRVELGMTIGFRPPLRGLFRDRRTDPPVR